MELFFEKEKVREAQNAIEDLCLSCEGIGVLCKECPTDDSIKSLLNLNIKDGNQDLFKKEFEVLTDSRHISLSELLFSKNKVMIAQNSIENICSCCEGLGIYCDNCSVHEIRRTLASLPVKESNISFSPKTKKSSKGGCGSSCSTSCGTKK